MHKKIKYEYSLEKSDRLRRERGIGFEEIIRYIERGYVLDVIEHPNQERYSGQEFYVVNMDGYIYLVPFVQGGTLVFLKTIFPSRKYTCLYFGEGVNHGGKEKKFDIEDHEQQILDDFESGAFVSVKDAEKKKKIAKQAAENFMKEAGRVSIEISVGDLTRIQKKAEKEGVPYQALLSSIIHQFAMGRLVDRAS